MRAQAGKEKGRSGGGDPERPQLIADLVAHPEGEGVGPAPPIYPGGAGGLMKPERRKEPGQ